MSKPSNRDSQTGKRSAGSGAATNSKQEKVYEGYVPLEKRGYTPMSTTSKLPRPPKGGTGQSSPKATSHKATTDKARKNT